MSNEYEYLEKLSFTGISIIGIFSLQLCCIWAYRACIFSSTALNL